MNEYIAEVSGKKKEITYVDDNTVIYNGQELRYSLSKISDYSFLLKLGNKVYDVTTTPIGSGKYGFLIEGHYFEVTIRTKLQQKALELSSLSHKRNHHSEVKAPMPGMIIKIKKQPGDSVELGESILLLEAMKMENNLHSPSSGIIKQVHIKEGESVEKDQVLFVIDAE